MSGEKVYSILGVILTNTHLAPKPAQNTLNHV